MKCSSCGRIWGIRRPEFCTTCGERLGGKKRNTKLLIAIGAGVLLVLITLAIALPLTLIKPAGPAAVFASYVQAIERGDYATAHAMLTAKDASGYSSTDLRTIWEDKTPANMQVQKEEVTGTEAQLTVLNSDSGETLYFPCYLENGKWKISFSEFSDDTGDDSSDSDVY
jgi:hypothetical protein